MDPIMKAWMFYNWMEDYNDEFKLLENQSYLIGSFTNPEAVRKILGQGVETHTSSNEEFDKLSEQILTNTEEKLTRRQKRKRKIETTKG
jgi:hypothetical protein